MQQEATERNTYFSVTPAQEIALARLAAGATVSAAAEAADVNRCTIYRWMNADPEFVAELNRARWEHREELRGAAQNLAARALGTLTDVLAGKPMPDARVRCAIAALKLTRAVATDTIGPTDPEMVCAEWARETAAGRVVDVEPADAARDWET
jgi:hypothetical protein